VGWARFFFGFKGRLNRAKYWLLVLISYVGIVFAMVMFMAAGGAIQSQDPGATIVGVVAAAIGFVLLPAALVSSLAAAVRRLQDRNKSGSWVLVFYFIPGFLLGLLDEFSSPAGDPSAIAAVLALLAAGLAIWGLVEIGVLRGTRGDNKYGRDPVATATEVAAAFD
jgi:uncharacterized membrane protein YhaH (DUF805 family)